MSCRKKVTGIFFIILILSGKITGAQSSDLKNDSTTAAADSTYIKSYTHLLTARFFLLFQNAAILINPADEHISKIVYRPNVNVRIGIAGFYKWLGVGISVDNPFYKTNREAFGKTSTIDMRINAFGRQVAGELFFQKYKSFYVSSPERSDGSHYIIPDMRTISFGIAGYYMFNSKKFSMRAAFIQNEGQKKSAGSLVIRPAFLYYQISSDNGIIPPEIMNNYQIPGEKIVKSGSFYAFEMAPGYVYTLVFMKNFYITAAAFPGIAAQFAYFCNDVKEFEEFEFVFHLSGRCAVGYNSDKWFLGASVQMGFNEIPDKLSNARFNYDVAQIRIWGGTRFNIFKKK